MHYRPIVRMSRLILVLLTIAGASAALASTQKLLVDIEGTWVRLDDRSDAFHLLLDTTNHEVFLFEGDGDDGYRLWGSIDIADEVARIRRALIDRFEVAPTPEAVTASIEDLPVEQRTLIEQLFAAALGYGGSGEVGAGVRPRVAPVSYGKSTLGNRLISYGCELVEARDSGSIEAEICLSSSSRDAFNLREKRSFLVAILMAGQLQARLDEQSPYMNELDMLSRVGLAPLLTGHIRLPECLPGSAPTPTHPCLRPGRPGWGD